MKFPPGRPPSTGGALATLPVSSPPGADPLQVVAVPPTQIYETTLMLAAFWLLWRLRGHRHAVGWRFGVYLVLDRKSTRLNSSHLVISYAVFCLKKKKQAPPRSTHSIQLICERFARHTVGSATEHAVS